MSVALDIETSGLEPDCRITCVGIASADKIESFTFGPADNWDAHRSAILSILSDAPLIYMFNGPGFDIPVMQRCFGLTDEVVGSWMAKLVDPLYAAKGLIGTRVCAKLAVVLALNGLPPKTGSGLDAVIMAREGRWRELAHYCANDTEVTRQLMLEKTVYWDQSLLFRPMGRHVWYGAMRASGA